MLLFFVLFVLFQQDQIYTALKSTVVELIFLLENINIC